jgi:hypothetical protein
MICVPAQTPPEQTSFNVQARLSQQELVLLVYTQLPVTVLQVSVVHTLLSLHTLAVPAQTPLEQTSLDVQALLSLHATVLLMWMQLPLAGLQESSVQTLLSLQFFPRQGSAPCRAIHIS